MLQSTTNKTTKPITTTTWTNNTFRTSAPSGPSLRDEDGFCYFGPVDHMDAILNVNNYVHVVPLAPLEAFQRAAPELS